MPRVLITGASGFIASHCVLEMLNHGYEVRGTLRSLNREPALRAVLAPHTDRADALSFVTADLMDEGSWQDAARDCDGILHLASPVPVVQPQDPDEVIVPARTGALNVLRAAHTQGIARVVLTSSTAAVMSNGRQDSTFTHEDWSDLDRTDLSPYVRSKTVAERAAWEFVASHPEVELATVNPALVLGPALEKDYGSSLEALYLLLTGAYPLLPKLGFEIVDVRDVAALHRLALETSEAAGQRFLCANGFRWFTEIAATLQAAHPDRKVTTRAMPDWVTRLAGVFLKEIQQFLPDLSRVKKVDNAPAKAIGWQPRDVDTAIRDGAASLIAHGVIEG
ncbi:MAG: aldehyde reductase [Pseudomonadota bacterium]